MEKLIQLLKEAGMEESFVSLFKEEFESFKSKTIEDSKLELEEGQSSINEEAIKEKAEELVKEALESKIKELEENVEIKLEEQVEAHKADLSSKVSLYLESKKSALKKEAYQQVITETKDNDANSLLGKVASLVSEYYEETNIDADKVEEIKLLKKECQELKDSSSELKLEYVSLKKKSELIEEGLVSPLSVEEDEVGSDDLLNEGEVIFEEDKDKVTKDDDFMNEVVGNLR